MSLDLDSVLRRLRGPATLDLDAILSRVSATAALARAQGPLGSCILLDDDSVVFEPDAPAFSDVRLLRYDNRHDDTERPVGILIAGRRRSRVGRWGPSKEWGYLHADPIGRSVGSSDEYRDCARDFRALKRKLRRPGLTLWAAGQTWLPAEMRGRGLGRLLYEQILVMAARRGAAVAPDACRPGGSTSDEAMRVWRRLAATHPHEGFVVVRSDLLPQRGSRRLAAAVQDLPLFTREG